MIDAGVYIEFGKRFEKEFLQQGAYEDRDIDRTVEIGWNLLVMLPEEELDRVDSEMLEKYYRPKKVLAK